MVSSRVYPGLERKPGGPDNWVEAAGGLPSYIERIAKHLHYERGFSISRAIATAVNTVKRWARGGHVTKYGTMKRVSPKTIAQAVKALASWEAKKRAGKLALSEEMFLVIDLTEVSDDLAFDLLTLVQPETGAESSRCGTLASMDTLALAERANVIEDDEARGRARAAIIELSSSIPARRRGNGRAKDGRPSYKKQGKWGHGFVPLDQAAKEAKAKGSPIAMKRMNRLFKGGSSKVTTSDKPVVVSESGLKKGEKGHRERVSRVAYLGKVKPKDAKATQRVRLGGRKQAALQAWEDIPSANKTVRNGKRYVLTTFGGRQILTEWQGGVRDQTPGALNKRKVVRSVTAADMANMSTAELRQLLKNPRTPKSVRTALRRMIKLKEAKAASRG